MLEFENVTRKYGSKVAVDGLSFSIPAGQLFAFLGPNGAGKTTTIKMLVGLLRPTEGGVRVGGFDTVRQTRPRGHAADRLRARQCVSLRKAFRPGVPGIRGRDAGLDQWGMAYLKTSSCEVCRGSNSAVMVPSRMTRMR